MRKSSCPLFIIILLFSALTGINSTSDDFRQYEKPPEVLLLDGVAPDSHYNINDKESIYVSPKGNDLYEGSRSRPFKTLRQAIIYAQENDRRIIHCALGEYEIESSLLLSGFFKISGGFNPVSWEKAGFEQHSILKPGRYFPEGSSLVQITGGQMELEGFEFRDKEGICPVLIALGGGEVRLADSKVTLSSRPGAVGVLLDEGRLEIADSQFIGDKISSGALLVAEGGRLMVKDSKFLGPLQGDDFTALLLKNRQGSQFTGIDLNPGRGKRIIGVLVQDSELNTKDSRFNSGRGKELSLAVELKDGELTMNDCTVEGDPEGNYTCAVTADNSTLSISGSRIKASGKLGAFGIKLHGGEIKLDRTRISSSSSVEFLYLVEIRSGKGYFANNILTASTSGDSICAVVTDSHTDWYNNTIIGAQGTNLTVGFMLRGMKKCRLINNILLRRGAPKGTAIYSTGPENQDLALMANNLSGWETLLRIGSTLKYGSNQIAELNHYDGDSYGGFYHKNISEAYDNTIRQDKPGEYRLQHTSACVNAGIDIQDPEYGGPEVDFDGQKRPAPAVGIRPAYDIGAHELY